MKTLRNLREGLKVTAVDTLGKTIPKSKINSVQGAIMKRDIQGTRQDESTMSMGEIDSGLYSKKNTYPKTKTKPAAVGEDISQRISAIAKSAKDSVGKVVDSIPRPFDTKEVSKDLGIKDKSAQNSETPNAIRWNNIEPKSSKTKVEQVEVDEASNPAFHNPFSQTKSSSTVEKIQKAKTRKINQPGQGVYKKQTPSTRKRVVNNYMKMLKDIGEQTEYTVKHGDTEHTVNDYDHAVNKARSILAYGKAKEVYIHTNGNPTHKWQVGKHIEKIKEEIDLDEAGRCWTGYKPKPGKKPYSPGSCVKEEEVDEAANWAQQAATAINMKKKGIKPKNEAVTIGSVSGRGNIHNYDRNPGPKDGSELENVPFHAKTEKQKKLQNALTDLGKKMKETHPKLKEDTEQLDERGLDVGHQKRQMSKHFDRYIQAVRAGKFNQARAHYKKYNEHKQTLQKAGKTT